MLGEKHFCEAGLLLSNTLSFLCVHQLLYYYSQKQLLLESAIGFNEMNRVAKSNEVLASSIFPGELQAHTLMVLSLAPLLVRLEGKWICNNSKKSMCVLTDVS